VHNVLSYLRAGDVLVVNNTRVFPDRLIGNKVRPGQAGKSELAGRVEVFLVREVEPLVWEALVRPGRGLNEGSRIEFAGGELAAEVIEWREDGRRVIRFRARADLDDLIDRFGRTPLPPYIKRDQDSRLDPERYQTVYAAERGAIAAPTAGLHFTAALLEAIAAAGVEIVQITLHVGYGTFQPVRAERVEDHRVEPEIYTIGDSAAACINRALNEQQRIIAVGTTTTRALESAARSARPLSAGAAPPGSRSPRLKTGTDAAGFQKGSLIDAGTAATGLFIFPGFQFRVISGLITNFHLPRSSLLMLVSAFAGRDLVL